MENVYKPTEFNCSNNIPIQEYFTKYSELLSIDEACSTTQLTENEALAKIMGVSVEEVSKLAKHTSIKKLTCEEEIPTFDPPDTVRILDSLVHPWPIGEKACATLETARLRKQLFESDEYEKYIEILRREFNTNMKIKTTTTENNIEILKEILIYVRIYHPMHLSFVKSNVSSLCKFSHEIVLLGSNTLADLRDYILCNRDIGLSQKVTEPNPDFEKFFGKSNELYPSGLIFIDGVLYNDFRKNTAEDYSKTITEWAKSKKVGKFETAEMKDVPLYTLNPRIGYPYVYQHQGNCEHVLVFSDMRLITKSDILKRDEYPHHHTISRYNSVLCSMCYAAKAKFVLLNADRLIYDVNFQCEDCFKSYNFIDGVQVGKFDAYPYFDRAALM